MQELVVPAALLLLEVTLMSLIVGDETQEELECKMLLLGMKIVTVGMSDRFFVTKLEDENSYFFKVGNSYQLFHHSIDRRRAALAALRAYQHGEPRNV